MPAAQGYSVWCGSELGLTSPRQSKAHVFQHHPHLSRSEDIHTARWPQAQSGSVCSEPRALLALSARAFRVDLEQLFSSSGAKLHGASCIL